MPVYEYQCKQCSASFTQFFTGFNTDEKECPCCGEKKELEKKISAPSSIKKNNASAGKCVSCASKNCGSCGS